MMSGMRKPSPISISSPRETTTSPPAGQFIQRQKDGRGVVVDGDAGAPRSRSRARRCARRACRAVRWRVVFQVRIAGRWMVWGPSGARPRLVCSTTPVALMTRRSDGRSSVRQRALDALRWTSLRCRCRRRRESRRAPSSTRRTSATTSASRDTAARIRARATSCTAGNSRSFSLHSRFDGTERTCHLSRRARTAILVDVRGVAQPG
jgi:hypothetical protein